MKENFKIKDEGDDTDLRHSLKASARVLVGIQEWWTHFPAFKVKSMCGWVIRNKLPSPSWNVNPGQAPQSGEEAAKRTNCPQMRDSYQGLWVGCLQSMFTFYYDRVYMWKSENNLLESVLSYHVSWWKLNSGQSLALMDLDLLSCSNQAPYLFLIQW